MQSYYLIQYYAVREIRLDVGMVASTFFGGVFFDAIGPVPKILFLLTIAAAGGTAAVLLGTMESYSWPVPLLLAMLGASLAPAMYLKPSAYILLHVDERCAPTVLALIDTPGYLVSAILFQFQPQLLVSGGWALLFAVLGVMIGVAGCSLAIQQALENHTKQRHHKRD